MVDLRKGSTKKIIEGTSYDINKIIKTQSYVENSKIASMKAKLVKEGSASVPPIRVRVHNGEALVVQGHHRLEAFRQLGYNRIPIKYVHKSELGKVQKDGDYFRTLEELLDGRIYN